MEDTPLWLTPMLFLPGVALLILSTATRYANLQAEIRVLISEPEFDGYYDPTRLRRRARLYRDALTSLYVAAALLPLGSVIGMVSQVALLTSIVAVIVAVIYATANLIVESKLSLRMIEATLARAEGRAPPPR